ncbi:MAG: MBOAT family O-acyltransferase [Bacteroidota bacterium]
MLFNSFSFVLLVIITFSLYYLPFFRSVQIPILIIASFIFYSANQPALLLLLISSIVINIITSYLVIYGKTKLKKIYAAAGVVANLSLLTFFKYSPLFGRTFFNGTGSLGELLLMIPLPIGISFYTFQGISLLVDTFASDKMEKYKSLVHKSFFRHSLNTALFISFFPKLVAGPIVKAHDFIPQIKEKTLKDIDWESCFRALVLGYFLKMVVADNLKEQTFWIAFPYFQNFSTATLLIMIFGYSMQIFADFAGYSLIAIGIARLLGYNIRANFNFPYISKTFSEFWTRWHISLSSFLREYLYFPLGGNRIGKMRTYMNLMVVMFLGGLWHGAAWSYAMWGSFHGFALAVERFFRERINLPDTMLLNFLKMTVVFILVTFAWLLFKLPEFSHVMSYMEAIVKNADMPLSYVDLLLIKYNLLYSLPVCIYHLYYLYTKNGTSKILKTLQPVIFALLLFLIISNSGSPASFVYFQF